jgi:ADP-ribose pyrophosphatase
VSPERREEEAWRGHLITVEVQRWGEPDRVREVVRHPGAVAVLAIHDGHAILVRQLREAVGERLLEIPAGIRDVEGEPAEETARRELLEETGYRAVTLRPLGRIHTSPGFTDEVVELYVGEVEPGTAPSEPGVEVVAMPLDEVVAAIRRGEITDAKTAVAVLLAAGQLSGASA